MINEPISVNCDNFHYAWLEIAKKLIASDWELRNLIAHIRNPRILDQSFHDTMMIFAKAQGLLSPKQVAYTIFPHTLDNGKRSAQELFIAYNKSGGVFERVRTGWGTYFRQMTNYEAAGKPVNQLDNIISAIRNRKKLCKAAYTIVIQKPGRETVRPRGGPCLNYLAVQAEPGQDGQPLVLGLLAIYRNHDFLERAYGNYWGLCNLLVFLAKETNGTPGPLTCVSSHAYVPDKKRAIKQLVESL